MEKSFTVTIDIDSLLDEALSDIQNILSEENCFNDKNLQIFTENFIYCVEKLVYNIVDYKLKHIPVVNEDGLKYLFDCLNNKRQYSKKNMQNIDKRGCKIYDIVDFLRLMKLTDMCDVLLYVLSIK